MGSPSLDPAMKDFAVLQKQGFTAYMGICRGRTRAELMSYRRGISVPAERVRIEHNIGRKSPSDGIWILVRELVVSSKVLTALTGFTGWSTHKGKGRCW